MKSRNRKFILISISLFLFFLLFMNYLLDVIGFIGNPTNFSFKPLLYCVGLLVVMFLHGAAYVAFMDQKDKVRKIVDEEEWWKKWDRV